MTPRSRLIFKTAFGRYTAEEQIGEGGAGRVYRATDERGATWAIKVLDPSKASTEKLKRFRNEYSFCSQNPHKHIVEVVDHGLVTRGRKESPFYVMRFYPNSLRRLMTSGIAQDHVLPYFGQVLDGIEAAHKQGVTHRDLKPENILHDPQTDTLVIADFGIARFTQEQLYTLVETHPHTRLANFQYAAPEQRTREAQVDHRADIYALGLILNEMFTRQIPQGTGYKTIESVVPHLAYLDELVSSMLRQEPTNRPGSIEVLKNELIGRRNNFIERQKISQLKQTVVPVGEVDDPLIADPPRIVRFDWDNNVLTLTFQQPLTQKWVWALQNMGSHSSLYGKGPEAYSFTGAEARIQAREDEVQDLINYFKSWLPVANAKYQDTVIAEQRREEQQQRDRLRLEIEQRERRERVLRNVKL